MGTIEQVRQLEYRIIRVDGSEEIYRGRPRILEIQQKIGATCLDTVTVDRKNSQIMLVDDTGMIDGRPVNQKATALYHSICRPGTLHSIHGDVAIVHDEDFA